MGGVSSTGFADDLNSREAPLLSKPGPVFYSKRPEPPSEPRNAPPSQLPPASARGPPFPQQRRAHRPPSFRPNPSRRRDGRTSASEGRAVVVEAGTQTDPSPDSVAQDSSGEMAVQQKGAMIQHVPYGDLIPWGDPAWYRGEYTPYYTQSHVQWRARVREFVERDITPNAHQWDEDKAMPKEIFKKAAQSGLLACTVGVPWPVEYAGPGPEGFDYFHELILIDELSRCGSGGVVWGLFGGLSIGLPPVVNFASKQLRDRVVPQCLSGDKVICLAISEPYAGSDVANLKCTAEKSQDGRHYTINGEKKWITNGVFADFFTVAVRTGGKGAGGLSLLLIERSMPGVTTTQMKCTGVWPSGTAYITFDDVKVPVENLIGAENQGFKFIMYNFNHERWSLICQATRFARVCLEESFKFASKRATFGKKLMEHPVIRWKIAEMARQVEATHAQLESLTLQMNCMSKLEGMEQLGGPLALLKVQSTKVFEYCAREAAQIFGGSSYVRGGQGEKVERLYREVRAYAIPGGSEEIMLDLAVRQAMKQAQQIGRSKM